MSEKDSRDPLSEKEEKGPSLGGFFSVIGTFLIVFSGVVLFIVGLTFITDTNPTDQFDFALIFLVGIAIVVMSIWNLISSRVRVQLNEVFFAIAALLLLTISIFFPPNEIMPAFGGLTPQSYTVFIQECNAIGIAGSVIVLIAKKPNFGPEANRRIYQAVGGWVGTVLAVCLFLLGLYMTYGLNIAAYAGNGRYPGGKFTFFQAWVDEPGQAGLNMMIYWFSIYGLSQTPGTAGYISGLPNFIWPVGWTIMIGAAITFVACVMRNRINLKIASGVLIGGIIVSIVGLGQFNYDWTGLGSAFYTYYVAQGSGLGWADVYYQQLQLSDTGLFTFGIVLVLIEFISLFFIVYASFATKPLDKWTMRRDRYIAAAEVATREGKLDSAIRYLELAAEWSSKVDEEDKAVELLTKVRQIQKKAIQMKKAKAADDAKKKLKAEEKGKKEEKKVEEAEEAGTKKSKHVAKQAPGEEAEEPEEEQEVDLSSFKAKLPSEEEDEEKKEDED
jgi:hypothetical protein